MVLKRLGRQVHRIGHHLGRVQNLGQKLGRVPVLGQSLRMAANAPVMAGVSPAAAFNAIAQGTQGMGDLAMGNYGNAMGHFGRMI